MRPETPTVDSIPTAAPAGRPPAPLGGALRLGMLTVLVLIVASRLPVNWRRPLLEYHDFRQTQTALTAYWYVRDGIDLLRPPLPVFGANHAAIPMEFPAYQALVALLVKAAG